MNRHATFLILGLLVLITRVASATTDGDPSGSDTLTSAVLGFLPIVIFIFILLYVYRRQMKSPGAMLQQRYLERQIEHTQRVEELLERIAAALEKK